MKKLLVLLLTAAMLLSAVACAAPAAAEQGKVFNIYCWNDEFQTRFNDYFQAAGLVPEGVEVKWTQVPSADNAYQDALDQALLNQESASADEKVDMFLIEADYALKYVNSDYTLDVVNDIGLTDADMAEMYQYTKDICTDANGALKGVSWQACPAGLIYRRSIAKDVLGSDDPVAVQEALNDWTKFETVAAQAKEKGYFMVAGYDDDYRVFSNNVSKPWVDATGKIQIDDNIMNWVKQTKTFTDNEYNTKAILWSPEQWDGAKKDGKVMCYFGPAWFFDFSLCPNVLDDPEKGNVVGNGSFGDWAIVKGPQGYFWGGTWICGATGTDNAELVKQVMLTLTCDAETLTKITKEKNDFTNNVSVMESIAADTSYGSEFLGGQNFISVLLDSATSIDLSNLTPYDQGCNEKFQEAMRGYFNGAATQEEAMENFYTLVNEKYPNLTH